MPIILLIPATFWTLLHRFGVLVFLGLGLLDGSVLPTPGSMDAVLIALASHRHNYWWYYALIATIGSVCGLLLTYHFGAKGGKEALAKRFGEKRMKKLADENKKWGFWSMFLAAMAPPPIPTSAFVATAGALRVPRGTFLLSITSGRLLRFMIVGWIASRFGAAIFQFFGRYYKPALWTLIALGIAGGLVAAAMYLKSRKNKGHDTRQTPEEKAA